MPTPSSTQPVRTKAASHASLAPKKSAPSVSSVGNRPLHGTSAFVSIPMRRSRSESMIRQPLTPAALQPKPMHIVSACLPQLPHFSKHPSIRNATRGRYPASSSSVKSGKKIRTGGSITETTFAVVW